MRKVTFEDGVEIELPDAPKYHPLEAKGRILMGEMLDLIRSGDTEAARGFIRLGVLFANRARYPDLFSSKGWKTINRAAKGEAEFPSVVTKGESTETEASTKEFFDQLPLGKNVRGLVAKKPDKLSEVMNSIGLEFQKIREEGPDGHQAFFFEREHTGARVRELSDSGDAGPYIDSGCRERVERICRLPVLGKRGSYIKWAKCITEAIESSRPSGFPSGPDDDKGWIFTVVNPTTNRIDREKEDRAKLQKIETAMKQLPAWDAHDKLAAPYDEFVKPSRPEKIEKVRLQNRYDKYRKLIDLHGTVVRQDIFKTLKLRINGRLRSRHEGFAKKKRK